MEQAILSSEQNIPSDHSRPSALGARPASARPISAGGTRLLFIDNIRWVMIMLVLSMHAAVTYSGHGSWYVKESATLGLPQDLTFLTYQVFLQSFFMGFLFFIAGYFVPAAYDKKGAVRFLKDRAYRLGLPALFYMLVINPIVLYYLAGILDKDQGFFGAYGRYIQKGYVLYGSGPLWFCIALLFFCVVYAGCRVVLKPKPSAVRPTPFPRTIIVTGFIALITLSTFLVRIPWPNGTAFYNMQFCYFSQYVAFFIAGTLAFRNSWLATLQAKTAKSWGFIGLFGGLAIWFTLIVLNRHATTYKTFDGGWYYQTLGMCVLESLAGTGISIGLLGLFREKFNRQGRWALFFSASAFAVYVFHTPILIIITNLLTGWQAMPLLKFLAATVLCISATYALSAFIFRRIPLLKNIL